MADRSTEEEDINDEFNRRRGRLRIAPGPVGEDVPQWMNDGIEELYGLFNTTADIWDKKFSVESDNLFYRAVSEQVPITSAELDILDLGSGTGIQLESVFARAPNAKVTGIDLAPNMLDQLRFKFVNRTSQLRLVQGSILDLPLGDREYDYVISTLTMHHFSPENKVRIYRKVREALHAAGLYIEGDQSTTAEGEKETLYWYHHWIAKLPGGDRSEWNYDITLSVGTQKRILRQSGYSEVQLTWEEPGKRAVLVAKR